MVKWYRRTHSPHSSVFYLTGWWDGVRRNARFRSADRTELKPVLTQHYRSSSDATSAQHTIMTTDLSGRTPAHKINQAVLSPPRSIHKDSLSYLIPSTSLARSNSSISRRTYIGRHFSPQGIEPPRQTNHLQRPLRPPVLTKFYSRYANIS
jgi:hypothetical protein